MIGFPKTLTDFSQYKKSFPKKKDWQDCFENQMQSYLDNQNFFSKNKEDWKYFPFQKIMNQKFVFNRENSTLLKEPTSPNLPSPLFISVKNGRFSTSFKPSKDFFICSWKDFLLSKVELDQKIKQRILNTLKKQRNPFCSLNNSLYSDGLILIIKKSLNQALEIHYTQSDTNDLQGLNLRNFIFIEKKVSAQIVETFHGRKEEKPLFFNIQTDCFVDQEAELEHCRIDKAKDQDTIINQLFSELSKASKACFFSLSLNAGISRYHSELTQEEKSFSEVRGLSLIEGKKYTDHKVSVSHKGTKGVSRQLYKSFLFDSAKQIFQGFISIEKQAQKSDTSQLSKNFLFSKGAFAVTSPELDIEADNVKASHGATVSPFTENQNLIFYLQSRGIDPLQAFHLVLSGLIEDVASCLQSNTQKMIKNLLNKKLQSIESSVKRSFA